MARDTPSVSYPNQAWPAFPRLASGSPDVIPMWQPYDFLGHLYSVWIAPEQGLASLPPFSLWLARCDPDATAI
jgi:hypothetical protein